MYENSRALFITKYTTDDDTQPKTVWIALPGTFTKALSISYINISNVWVDY